MTYSFQSAQCHVGLKLVPFRIYCLLNWLVKRYCLLLLDVWILTTTLLISLENARRGPIRSRTNLQERVQWLHLKRFERQSLSRRSNYSFLEGTRKYLPRSQRVGRRVALSWHSCLSQLCSCYSLIRESTRSLWKNNTAWLEKKTEKIDSCQQV